MSPTRKDRSRARIIDAARRLFNRHGFAGVGIDTIMAEAGLTRGGFYAHFPSKAALYAEAVRGFTQGRGAVWRESFGVETRGRSPEMAQRMIDGYLSDAHLDDLEAQCPLIALPSDAARGGAEVKAAYQGLLETMVGFFEANAGEGSNAREKALAQAALCVGGMVLARTLPDSALACEVRAAARAAALGKLGEQPTGAVAGTAGANE